MKSAPLHPEGHAAEALSRAAVQVADAGYFSPSPSSFTDEQERRLREVVVRRGQPEFRSRLIAAYGGRCAVTGCDALAALEAAHIVPYGGPLTQVATNGLLLRADIHTLFDIDLIGIDPDSLSVSVSPAIKESVYGDLQGIMLSIPTNAGYRPNLEALRERWKQFDGVRAGFAEGQGTNEGG